MLGMEIDVTIELPELWEGDRFQQDEWGSLNFLIGPNGTGKTLFAEQLENQIRRYSVRYLNAERLSGMERQRYGKYGRTNLQQGISLENEDTFRQQGENYGLSSDAYIELRNKPDLKARIQAILSGFFDREIQLEVEGGYLKPKMRDMTTSDSYDLRENESHGLKQLISLLTLIHDDEYDIIIIDEPELHLHPQYQRFLLKEIRKLAGDPENDQSRAFFLITHSPIMVDFRNLQDLKNVYSFRSRSQPPYSVSEFDDEDKYHIKNLLPRLNTHHNEILFSRQPLLVEGYKDERIFSLAIEKHNGLEGNPESSMIGVGGEGEIDSFLRFCRNLGLEPRIIADLDILFKGDLRETLSELDLVREKAQERGVGSNLLEAIGPVERRLNDFIDQIEEEEFDETAPETLRQLSDRFQSEEESAKKRYYMYRAIRSSGREIVQEIDSGQVDSDDISFVEGRVDSIMEILGDCGYYVLEEGELEDYLLDEDTTPFGVSDNRKSEVFQKARNRIHQADSSEEVSEAIGDLESVLRRVTASKEVNLVKYLEQTISKWAHEVQWVVRRGEVESIDDLRDHDIVGQERYERLFSVEEFQLEEDAVFQCKIQLNSALDPEETTWEFGAEDSTAQIDL